MEDRPITLAIRSSNVSTASHANQSSLKIWGRQPLQGHVPISGAKNSALVLMAGALLCSEDCRLRNVPSLADVNSMSEILMTLGVKIDRQGDIIDIKAGELSESQAPYELVSQLRASFFAIGPILARLGIARVPLPGGCAIGARPVDLHVRGLQSMGAEVHIEHGIVHAHVAGANRRLKGARIYLDYPSVGATETLMMAATLADGETIIENAAQEPEVIDLANFCRAMGARIHGAGSKTIIISGVPSLHSADYSIIPDRIEAGTFLIAGAITGCEINLSPIIPEHLSPVLAKLKTMGVKIRMEGLNHLSIIPGEQLKATDIKTLPYPGFPTDMQAPFMALLTLCEGNSLISETVFENRFGHVPELSRMGADIQVKGNTVLVRGVPLLSGAPVTATDLRASAALVLAALAAEGETTIQGLKHLDRGYEQLEAKLRQLGAKIERFDPTPTE
ncbi:UDP-N-acetylglucosamine 1-carboxyvinyltransferase [Planktothrix agardhii]|uniref:UDP-N-acetylglucosamine 1-carboxyvinyltransferase n=2 Tax=Planktothrix agardhii TaxID=1160 RepID=A0A073CGJ5_PLAA1|nr:UDP-N-acetylglucosamine 1-carboxyvinyltransferase [Planktothrix agardhii]CAD5964889.1 UDP-N-acetylglucosamine 1-carboxyvinyltransferase [Planktothrix rubescens]BBD52755.1 UDP-N-acetylglucosamine 1-carboxyvinyltransferase [Planktothrix agardhii NIES-204]KEI67246.1 MurZ [Planktothrix agardhii NIVA-CYA 126/8]MCB8752897.1 UDP-N-acetylglucosamine 1-carboxyvinyltransferase [Planktothrix agardhii 1810]MCB8759938.1 UDP-N-acetylglucosamine 1-carboxyvinyltransferase [Planktothrix agardhii 1813]